MPFEFLSNHMKETADRIDGFLTGCLIVELDKQVVSLGQDMNGRTSYLELTELDHIEVRNGNEYMKISIQQALETMVTGTKDWPLFAGLYARVKVGKKESKELKDNNKNINRIHFYTSKIAQLGSIHPTKRNKAWESRSLRLKKYKAAMNKSFKEGKSNG